MARPAHVPAAREDSRTPLPAPPTAHAPAGRQSAPGASRAVTGKVNGPSCRAWTPAQRPGHGLSAPGEGSLGWRPRCPLRGLVSGVRRVGARPRSPTQGPLGRRVASHHGAGAVGEVRTGGCPHGLPG